MILCLILGLRRLYVYIYGILYMYIFFKAAILIRKVLILYALTPLYQQQNKYCNHASDEAADMCRHVDAFVDKTVDDINCKSYCDSTDRKIVLIFKKNRDNEIDPEEPEDCA